MSTRRLYYDDSYLQNFDARVMSCLPAGPVQGPSGMQPGWEVVLGETVFYPDSGGQPHDLGLLGDAAVLGVRDEDEEIVHIVNQELSAGSLVRGCVNWPRRFDHMQQHTGQHLLSAMFLERFGLPTVSFHLGTEICTIDLRGAEPKREQLIGAQRAANQVIFDDRPVHVRYGTAEQLERLGVRKQVDRKGILRAIEIEGADLQPCGGTHVRSTGHIGMILVRGCSKVRQDWRVEFVCGHRAEQFATADFSLLKAAAEAASCAPAELPDAIRKLQEERDVHSKNLRAALQDLAAARANELLDAAGPTPDGMRVIAMTLRPGQAELLQPLATEIVKRSRSAALLAMEESGALVFAQHPDVARDLPGILKQVLGVYPGKGGGSKDFVRAKLQDGGSAAAAVEMARRLVGAS